MFLTIKKKLVIAYEKIINWIWEVACIGWFLKFFGMFEGWMVGDPRGCGHAMHVQLNVDWVTGIRI